MAISKIRNFFESLQFSRRRLYERNHYSCIHYKCIVVGPLRRKTLFSYFGTTKLLELPLIRYKKLFFIGKIKKLNKKHLELKTWYFRL